MKSFLIMWSGQLVSLLGSAITAFALPIWVFGKTERVQELVLLGLAFILPLIILSPLAGTIVDRHDRKLLLILSDFVAGLSTIVVFILVTTNTLHIWHLYLTSAINGAFQSLQWPAYSAAITVMIPKEQYGRADGLTSLAHSGSSIFAPLLAGSLLSFFGLQAVLLFDIFTFIFAIATLFFIHIPQPPQTKEGQKGKGSFWRQSTYGLHYILGRPSLLGVQLVFAFGNFFLALAFTTLPALVLFKTDQSATILARVTSAGAIGGVLGGVLMSVWGGPKRRIHGVLMGWIGIGLLGTTLLGLGRIWPVWATTLLLGTAMVPIVDGSNQAIWQSKVAPDIQGRVFSIRRVIALAIDPLARVIAIPLADRWLEPALAAGGSVVEPLVGYGPGAGISMIFIFSGIACTLVGLSGYLFPTIRNVEIILPDHETLEQV